MLRYHTLQLICPASYALSSYLFCVVLTLPIGWWLPPIPSFRCLVWPLCTSHIIEPITPSCANLGAFASLRPSRLPTNSFSFLGNRLIQTLSPYNKNEASFSSSRLAQFDNNRYPFPPLRHPVEEESWEAPPAEVPRSSAGLLCATCQRSSQMSGKTKGL